VRYHRRLEATHPYRSSLGSWLLMQRPVLMYYERCDAPPGGAPVDQDGEPCSVAPGSRARILALGNPVLWWAALPAYAVVAWFALVRRRWPEAVVGAFALALTVPWLLAGKPGYVFYATPVVPFAALAVALAVERVDRGRRVPLVMLAVLGAAVASAVALAPFWFGSELTPAGVDARLLFDSWR
jgi:dolichyl-phosphate-mannose-protein mannosyltransferase